MVLFQFWPPTSPPFLSTHKMIMDEGVVSLNVQELQNACRERGMRAIGVSVRVLRERLQQWLDLHIKEGVPASLLLLTRGLYLPEKIPKAAQIRAAVESLPGRFCPKAFEGGFSFLGVTLHFPPPHPKMRSRRRPRWL